jgi:hypothetical protein
MIFRCGARAETFPCRSLFLSTSAPYLIKTSAISSNICRSYRRWTPFYLTKAVHVLRAPFLKKAKQCISDTLLVLMRHYWKVEICIASIVTKIHMVDWPAWVLERWPLNNSSILQNHHLDMQLQSGKHSPLVVGSFSYDSFPVDIRRKGVWSHHQTGLWCIATCFQVAKFNDYEPSE